jgi:hypothetical protein
VSPPRKPEWWSQKRQPLLGNGSVNMFCDDKYINTTVGHSVFYAVHVISNTQYVMKGKDMITSFQNFFLYKGSLDVITYINEFYSNRT